MLEKLNSRLQLLDTELKIATLVEALQSKEISSSEIVESLENGNLLACQVNGSRKRKEAVKRTLDTLAKQEPPIVTKFDNGRRFQQARFTYAPSNSEIGEELETIAYLMMHTALQGSQVQEFTRVGGGSFSGPLKHVRQGLQLTQAFYPGMNLSNPEDLEQNYEPEMILGTQFSSRVEGEQPKEFLRKYVNEKKVTKSKALTKDEVRQIDPSAHAGNNRSYTLEENSQTFLEELFFPGLTYLHTKEIPHQVTELKKDPQNYTQALSLLLANYQQNFRNQFS